MVAAFVIQMHRDVGCHIPNYHALQFLFVCLFVCVIAGLSGLLFFSALISRTRSLVSLASKRTTMIIGLLESLHPYRNRIELGYDERRTDRTRTKEEPGMHACGICKAECVDNCMDGGLDTLFRELHITGAIISQGTWQQDLYH